MKDGFSQQITVYDDTIEDNAKERQLYYVPTLKCVGSRVSRRLTTHSAATCDTLLLTAYT